MLPFRFLGVAASGVVNKNQLIETARRAESIGYSGLVVSDHLLDQHAPIPVLATIAAVTERLRIGTFMLNAGLRHPAVLAQELASLDVLSGGRLDIGIGAGWNRLEHSSIGVPFERHATRISRLGETIAILKSCFGDSPFSFTGRHYSIQEHNSLPKPIQRPHPPLLVGGGSRRALTLAGQEADIVGLAPRLLPGDPSRPKPDPRSLTAAATEEKISWIREAAGDRFGRIELNTYPTVGGLDADLGAGPVVVTNHARAEAELRADGLRRVTGMNITAEEVLESPHIFIGSVEGLTQKFIELRERFGVSSIMVTETDQLSPVVERLAER
jgi:probable F420-dependent oxidoreductase